MNNQAFIARQPVLDRQLKIIGYELLFRHDAKAVSANVTSDFQAGTTVLANTLCNLGTEWLLGDKIAFINISNPMLESDLLELLPPQRVVLELAPCIEVNPEFLRICRAMRGRGFRFAVDDYKHSPESAQLLELADHAKLDLQLLGRDGLKTAATELRNRDVTLIAEKVETKEDFKFCRELDFSWFQGFHFAHPETFTAKVINPTHAHVVDVLNKVRNNADIREIENAFKYDVALSFKLLRYINSVGFGLSCQIQSIRHAVTILGYQQLYRWLTLLLVTAGEGSTPPALTKTAVTRGRLTELLGQSFLERNERDNLFIVGVFSMLDVMLEMPLEKILEKLHLPEAVSDALLLKQGIYGPFLELAVACEGADLERIQTLAESLGLEASDVNKAHINALSWVEDLGI